MSAATLRALDWEALRQAFAAGARTTFGAAACSLDPWLADSEAVRAAYLDTQAWRELESALGRRLPLGDVADLRDLVGHTLEGRPIEAIDVLAVALSCRAALEIGRALRDSGGPRLSELGEAVRLDGARVAALLRSVTPNGELSETEFPVLADLRRAIQDHRAVIRDRLEELLRSEAWADALQDHYVTERNGRPVLPLKANRRKDKGIVHGSSQSGETVFVEPAELVEHSNEVTELEGALRREEHRILGWLGQEIAAMAPTILSTHDVITRVDLVVARAELGRRLGGCPPSVGDGGTLDVRGARHPVLLLRGVDVVPNDLTLTQEHPGLVLSGPNAGGKTVALKTAGLCALLVRLGVEPPVEAGSRVDLFGRVMAVAGDLQSVGADLSSFSGALLALHEVLDTAGPGSLVLLDEVGVGTDPRQGAALARATLEALVDAGARVVATTHFSELRNLAEQDPRFVTAASELKEGRPSYRLLRGRYGASFALAIARRMGLPEAVVTRATELLEAQERRLEDLAARLESDRATLEAERVEVRNQAERVQLELNELAERAGELDRRARLIDTTEKEALRERLRALELDLVADVARLQREGRLQTAKSALDRVRDARAGLVSPEESSPSGSSEWVEGQAVRVAPSGVRGVVERVLGPGRVEVLVGSVRMVVPPHALVASGPRSTPVAHVPRAPVMPPTQVVAEPADEGFRTDSNTCDLRGRRVDEALDAVDSFLDELLRRGETRGYILHGHGTGALKTAVRQWLPKSPRCRVWRPGDVTDGGDAFTVVDL